MPYEFVSALWALRRDLRALDTGEGEGEGQDEGESEGKAQEEAEGGLAQAPEGHEVALAAGRSSLAR